MQNIKRAFWLGLVLLTLLWLLADSSVWQSAGFFAVRQWAIQYSGIVAIAAMSVAMMLALRPRWPERWFGGLDKMYRLHKWLGIGALAVSVVHWLWAQGAKWAVGYGWLARPERGPRPPIDNPVEAFLATMRGAAEGLGEWAFYLAVILIVVALVRLVPYRLFYKTHRLLAPIYLVLVFHTIVLTSFGYWTTPLGVVLAVLLAGGTWAAFVALFRRIGAARRASGRIAMLQYYPAVQALEMEIDVGEAWPGHKAGQFAFAMSDRSEGAHPFTIASAWNPDSRRITLVAKELGDYTRRLRETLSVGKDLTLEGPYGCFTFEDDHPRQIWIGGGIGVTPFIAGMKRLALERQSETDGLRHKAIDLFHTSTGHDEAAIAKLTADAEAAGIRLHVLIDARDGLLTGERVRREVPDWRDASIWFCGPPSFGKALKADFAGNGLSVGDCFHHELFDMR